LDYLESVAGQASAKRFMLAFANKIDQIAQFPRQFPESPRFEGARKCIVYGSFILYYRIKGDEKVEVVSIRHAKSSRV
jgi:plasmid stabilization system protein ParE